MSPLPFQMLTIMSKKTHDHFFQLQVTVTKTKRASTHKQIITNIAHSGDSPSPRESLNSQIEESLNQIINSLNESTTANNPDAPDLNSLNESISANIPALKANVDTKDDEAREPIENFNETAKIVDRRHENEKENNFKEWVLNRNMYYVMPVIRLFYVYLMYIYFFQLISLTVMVNIGYIGFDFTFMVFEKTDLKEPNHSFLSIIHSRRLI